MAYTGDSADVYLRNPAGGISQLTFFAHPPGAANDIPLALGSNGGHIVQRGAGPDIWLAHLGQPSVYLTRRDYTFVASAAPHSRPARVLEISSVWHVAIGGSLFVVKDPLAPDTDGDGLPDAWEVRYGLDPSVASGANGASGDPDADGLTNLQEYQQQSHPRATFTRYLAEGATGAFFSTRLALFNPRADARDVLLRFLKSDGTTVTQSLTLSPSSRRDIDVAAVPGMSAAEFATVLESDGEVVMDRTMAWNETGYGSHAERALAAPSQTWYLAEGATFGAFDLFYLLQNSGVAPAEVDITFLRPSGVPIVRHYTLPAASRTTVWVDQLAGLESTDVSASIASDLTATSPWAVINRQRKACSWWHPTSGRSMCATNCCGRRSGAWRSHRPWRRERNTRRRRRSAKPRARSWSVTFMAQPGVPAVVSRSPGSMAPFSAVQRT